MNENPNDIIEGVRRDIKRNRQILLAMLLGPFLAVGVAIGGLWNQVHTSNRIAKDARTVAEFVTDCLVHPSDLCPNPAFLPTTTTRK